MWVLAIDPGTSNLGWVLMNGSDIVSAGVDHVWTHTSPIHATLVPAVVAWYQRNRPNFLMADRILIEQQYQAKGTIGSFPPLVVMEVLMACVELELPGKLRLIHAGSLKTNYKIVGTYEQRKAQVVQLAGLGHLNGRVHDIADCVLMIDYDKTLDERTAEALVRMEAKQARRAEIRAKAVPSKRIRVSTPKPKRKDDH